MDFSGAFAPPKKKTPGLFEFAAPDLDVSTDYDNTPTSGVSPSNAAYLPPNSTPTSVPTGKQPSAYDPPTGGVLGPNLGQQSKPNVVNDIYAPRLRQVGEQLSQAYQAPEPHGVRGVIGALLGARAPVLGDLISGDYSRKRSIRPLENQYKLLSGEIKNQQEQDLQQAQIGNYQSEGELRQHQGKYFDAETQAKLNPAPKIDTPDEQAMNALLKTTNPDTGKPYDAYQARVKLAQGIADTKPDKPSETDKDVSDYLEGHHLPNTAATRDKARSVLKTRDRPAKDPDLADLGKQIKQAQLEKLKEPTADEQRRADLANNLEENLGQLEDIARRRPELFGPLSGRLTGAKQYIGSSDPDVAALKNIEEQTGLAMVGAHAMRNAQHAEKAAQSITGANKNTADVLLSPQGPIASARKSLQTFRADANRRRNAIEGTGPATNTTTPTAPANALPSFAEWKKQQQQ